MEFVEGAGIDGLGNAKSGELCAAGGDGIEAGDAGAALRYWIRVVEIEVVDEVVTGQQTPPGVSIDAHPALVIADDLVEGGSGKAVGGIRGRDVLEHALCRNGPDTLRNDAGREDAGVELAGSHGVSPASV